MSAFSRRAGEIIAERGLKKTTVIRNAGIDKYYGYQMLSGRRNPSRDKIIRLCFGLRLHANEANHLLESAKFSRLLKQDEMDALVIECLNSGCSVFEFDEMVNKY